MTIVANSYRRAPLKLWTGSVVSWMQETHSIYSRPIAAEDSRGPLTRVTSECIGCPLRSGDSKRAGFSVELMGSNVQQTVRKLGGAVHLEYEGRTH
jgi:hypothetical protein